MVESAESLEKALGLPLQNTGALACDWRTPFGMRVLPRHPLYLFIPTGVLLWEAGLLRVGSIIGGGVIFACHFTSMW
jgi:hypothetical protein